DVLFSTIHAIISELMPAQNFYIAHYNSTTDTVHFPYYSDEFDASPPPRKLGLGLTDYVLRTGISLLASPQVFEQLVQSGQVESIGAASVDWLGVPLKSQQNETIGVMAIQTYAGEIRLNATDQKILEFVSAQVSMAIERKRAEEALLESEERFRNLYENAPIGLYRTTPDGKILLANRALIKMLGYSSFDELALRNLEHDGFEPSYERKEFISQIESQGEVHNLEARWLRHDGDVIVAKESAKAIRDANGKTLYFDGTVEDITERKIAEEKVMQLSRAVEQSPASIMITDLEGNIEYCNKKVNDITGYSMDELIGKSPSILSSGETTEGEYGKLWQTISSGNEWNGLFHNKRKNGELYWEYAQISPIKDESGKFSHYLAIKEDITERVNAEQELETYRNHLEELVKERTQELDDANKSLKIEIEKEKQFEMLLQQSLEKEKELSEMKSRFISTISHEFRTPLTSVLSSADLIQEYNEKLSNVEKLELLGRIKKSVRYLTKLLDDVLTISRTETGKVSFKPERLDIYKFTKECMEEIKSLMSDKHELKFNYTTERKKFFLDARLLRFILSNMLSNAIKYSPEGGKVELKISSNKEHLIIEVRDEGIGVPVSEVNKIFDSFYRTKNVGTIPGTGLGLTIVKRAVEMHNGEILVFSEINKGTTFSIRIPLSME
ncbi:MAG: PAS domain S-box protein, partial [Ignavibacteria bacterium]|nr:PAS domain S-box protein [Ignavibacteria bacterium]